MSAIASDNLRWFPPESWLANRSAYMFNEVAAMSDSTLEVSSGPRMSPLRRPYINKCSRTVSCASMAVNWGQTPSARRALRGELTTEMPLILTSPMSGTTSPPSKVHALSAETTERKNEKRTNHVERRRLACPIWSQHSEYNIPRNPKGDVVHHPVPIKRLGDLNDA